MYLLTTSRFWFLQQRQGCLDNLTFHKFLTKIIPLTTKNLSSFLIFPIDKMGLFKIRMISRKYKNFLLLSLSLIIFSIAFYIEVLSYILNTYHWTHFTTSSATNGNEPLKVLLVADPQIQGENNELPFLGIFTRWDSDRYLKRNFKLAKQHVKPEMIIFLGDLFDEGSTATELEYQRYYHRFVDIFQLPSSKEGSSSVKYIFLPGDNDVGGEGFEVVDPIKVKLFHETFPDMGCTQTKTNDQIILDEDLGVQFIKMNPLASSLSTSEDKSTNTTDIRILLSHIPILQNMNEINNDTLVFKSIMKPQLIIAAHSHKSSYYQFEPKTGLKIIDKFLVNLKTEDEGSLPLQRSSKISLELELEKSLDDNNVIHEIIVPTCSYRMGVPNMGYGALNIYRDGRIEYTVLWLPSRFAQLEIYIEIIFFIMISMMLWIMMPLIKCLRKGLL